MALNWEKANRRERERKKIPPRPRRSSARRQTVLDHFVQSHAIACFICGATKAQWAKTGISSKGPWAICSRCVGGDKR